MNAGAGNYRLQAASTSINAGTAAAATLTPFDLDGGPRVLGSAPDMGAYEFWSSASGSWFVDRAGGNDTTGNGSPATPYATVTKAVTSASAGHRIYTKAGNYGTDRPRITKALKTLQLAGHRPRQHWPTLENHPLPAPMRSRLPIPLLRIAGLLGAALTSVSSVAAGPRVSTSYAIATDVADLGGRRTTSASYTNDGSAGGVAALATVAAPVVTARGGYAGQLTDVVGLTLNSASPSVNERATVQLAAWQAFDDASLLALPAGSVTWSVQSGPLISISGSGLATAASVYQNSLAAARGSFGGASGTLTLTVLNVTTDDFGAYAGDGIDDAWQVQYFGAPPNPNAAPDADPTGTGQNNLFKYIAGLNPLDGSRFTLTILPVAGQPGQKTITFQPIVAGRTYIVTAKPTLTSASWTPINASAPIDNGSSRTVTDLSASGPDKFYRVEITKP